MASPASRTFSVRHVQLLRALVAAAAAVMITFSTDHSAPIGLAVFGGFAIVTALVLALGGWLALARGERMPTLLMAGVTFVAGMVSGVPGWRTTGAFFLIVIIWAAATGLIELLAGLRARRTARAAGEPADIARDHIVVGVFGLLLALALLVVPAQYAWTYSIEEAGEFVLTGITLAVGIFGLYGAFVAVFLGIAGFSPRQAAAPVGAEPIERGGDA